MANKNNSISNSDGKYFGKYRGTVTAVDNSDGMWKIKANVPKLLGGYTTGWALPCLSFAFGGAQAGFDIGKGDMVWIEFEQGNLDLPIWTGAWFTKGSAPSFKGIMINGTMLEFHDDSIEVHGNLQVDGGVSCGSVYVSSSQEGGGDITAETTIKAGTSVSAKTVTAETEVTGNGIKLSDHKHGGVTTGGDKTGSPE